MLPASVASIEELQALLERQLYIADRGLATSIYLALKLQRPLLLEGEAGVGKTEVAKVLASAFDIDLIRLQCYEGLDVSHAVYEWNYARQLLEIRLMEASGAVDRQAAARELFGEEFLIKRPLLQALTRAGDRPPVLLIDELDRADEEFEGFLLELLADFQITIPELGTIRAAAPPIVVITSNRTRELHDALKRRCLYFWIDYPDFDKELRIVNAKVPHAPARLAEQVTAFVQQLRTAELYKAAGVSETLDWVAALIALDRTELDPATIDQTLGILLKNQEDIAVGPRREDVRAPEPDADGGMSSLLHNLLHFGRLLHRSGSTCTPAGCSTSRARSSTSTSAGGRISTSRSQSLLIHRPQDIEASPRRSACSGAGRPASGPPTICGRSARSGEPRPASAPPTSSSQADAAARPAVRRGRADGPVGDSPAADDVRSPAAEPVERVDPEATEREDVSRVKDFAEFTEEELERAKAMIATLRWDLGCATHPAVGARRGNALDLRRVVRAQHPLRRRTAGRCRRAAAR